MSTPATLHRPGTTRGDSRPGRQAAGDRGHLTGTGTLVRLYLRRDRIRIAVWILGIATLVLVTASSVKSVYPDQADLDAAAALVADNAAVVALNGPDQAVDTLGGRIMFELSTYSGLVVALMSIFMLGRNTRAEEESGRSEMLRASVLGRHAPLGAALLVVGGINVVVGAAVALGLMAEGLGARGAWTFALGLAALGAFFAGVTLVLAQVTEHARTVYGAAGALLGAAYVLRAIGDVTGNGLSWLSPIGWMQAMRPYAGERWWPVLLSVVGAVLLLVLAVRLAERRDFGGGLVRPRAGPATASPRLRSPLALALRLQRGSLAGWTVGLVLLGAAYGSVGQDIEDFVGDNETMSEVITQGGGADLVDLYFATTLLMLGLIASGFAASSALRLRSEETADRAEPVLATPVSRGRWALSGLAVAFGGAVVVVAAGGLGMGMMDAVMAGDAGQVPELVVASLAHVPAVWVLVGAAVLVFGWAPRATLVTWALVAGYAVIGMFGELLDLPGWVRDLSPFEHVPQVPADDWAVGPLVALVALAAGLTALGLAGFRRRDVGAR